MTLHTVISTTRPTFLLLTPAVLTLAYALSYWQQGFIDFTLSILIFFAALSAHISVNTFNEYHDFRSGLDMTTERTPFSGGSGGLPENPSTAPFVLFTAWITLAITVTIGLYFIFLHGLSLLPIGIIGSILIISYTGWITRKPWLCLFTPGFAFGPIFIVGSSFVLTGNYSITTIVASLPIFFLVNNLLLLNQFPDVQADRQVGRSHIIIQYGKYFSSKLLIIFYILAYLTLILAVILTLLPTSALLGLLSMILAVKCSQIILTNTNHQNITGLLPAMALNVAITLLTPILIAIGIVLSM
jgi:1,4-dihydroxy-2-naphthoate polyprenyltransferase